MDRTIQTHAAKLRDLLTCCLLQLRAEVDAAEQAQQDNPMRSAAPCQVAREHALERSSPRRAS